MGSRGFGVNWGDAQEALRAEVVRATTLLRSIDDVTPHAVGDWNLGDVAMHLSQAWVVVPGLARNDLSRAYEVIPAQEGVAVDSLIRDFWDLGGVTVDGVQADPERNPGVLADRIEERAAEFFRQCEGRSATEQCPWLVKGTVVDLATLTCHLLNETMTHGGDVARAAGKPWPMDRAHATYVIEGFLLPVIMKLGPWAMVDQKKAAGVRATYDVRLRGGGSAYFVFDDGALQIEQPSKRRVHCHILADPAVLLMVIWGRQNQWTAIAKGQLLAWGWKPWLGPRLRMMMRNP